MPIAIAPRFSAALDEVHGRRAHEAGDDLVGKVAPQIEKSWPARPPSVTSAFARDPGNGFPISRDLTRDFQDSAPKVTRRVIGDRQIPRQSTEISEHFARLETSAVSRDCMVVDAVIRNRSPRVEFPANREKNREFCKKCALEPDFRVE
jgi:hypothetical protein